MYHIPCIMRFRVMHHVDMKREWWSSDSESPRGYLIFICGKRLNVWTLNVRPEPLESLVTIGFILPLIYLECAPCIWFALPRHHNNLSLPFNPLRVSVPPSSGAAAGSTKDLIIITQSRGSDKLKSWCFRSRTSCTFPEVLRAQPILTSLPLYLVLANECSPISYSHMHLSRVTRIWLDWEESVKRTVEIRFRVLAEVFICCRPISVHLICS